jgi:hypothetical protein
MEMKKMNLNEFKSLGYLQELNRRFLHPLGLALAVSVDQHGNIKLDDIYDWREEYIHFGISESDVERREKFLKNKEYIDSELSRMSGVRGYEIEEI